jgi:hypothetical protein
VRVSDLNAVSTLVAVWHDKRQKQTGDADIIDVAVPYLISPWQHRQLVTWQFSAAWVRRSRGIYIFPGLGPEEEMAVRKRDELDSLTWPLPLRPTNRRSPTKDQPKWCLALCGPFGILLCFAPNLCSLSATHRAPCRAVTVDKSIMCAVTVNN